MKITAKLLSALILLSFQTVFAQSTEDKALAKNKAQQAYKLEDEEGKFDEAIKLLEESQKLDPENITYPYELAYSYSGKKDHQKAAEILEKLTRHKDVYDLVYQALGNAYDYLGQPDKAIDTYEKGLKKFPKSGKIYTELGNMQLNRKDFNNAIKYYEKGIEAEPSYAANYYRASKIFLGSTEKVWGMLYGELFMNLERNSKRTQEMSKLLFDTYMSQIQIKGDTAKVSFAKNHTISIDALKDPKKFRMPFTAIYEMNLTLGVAGEKEVNLNSLSDIRANFLKNFIKGGNDKKYPNILFDYQQKLAELDFLEPYNHWILMIGDEPAFTKWQLANNSNWNNFLKWFNDNGLEVDDNHKLYRLQYQ
ncbi:tetratricopeptide repeat protein [Pedobacter sp. UBA5917]|jgi:tetratricopeptide (TPR) repeat protein|uniref:tetratricopeptide repeat protein n=1 Tax=Pedobacter sp. UBA5917 TaxID=1947061 RepID=UPI0025DE8EEE|nr:tetratricopeptide repeat protein [Pedobacter sp. UBA5917]